MAVLQQKVLILDRGSKYYKGLLIEYGLGNFEILKAEKLSVIHDLSFSNSLDSHTILSEEEQLSLFEYNFLRFTKTLFTEEQELVFLLRNEEIFFRNLEIPAEKEDLALEVLENEIESYLPYNLEEVQVLGDVLEIHDSIARVAGYAAKNSIIENYSKVAIHNGFSLRMLGIESLALASAIELLPVEEYSKKTICQIDIGYSQTIINILRKGKLVFVRTIPFGIGNLSKILTEKLKSQWEEEEIEEWIQNHIMELIEKGKSFFEETQFHLPRKSVEGIISEIKEEFHFFVMEIKRTLLSIEEDYISYILLSGGGSLINKIDDYLEKELNLQVKFYEIQLGENPIEPWILSIGTFFHYKRNQKDKIDFLQTPLGQTLKKGEIRLRVFFLPLFISGVSILIFLISFIIGILLERRQLQFYKKRIQEIATSIPELRNVTNPVGKAKKICTEKLNYWKNIVSGTKFLEIIEEVEKHTLTPDIAKIRFKSLRYLGNQMNLEFIVDNIANVVKVQEELQKSRMFSSVEVVRRDLIAGQKVRLQLSIKIKPKNIKFEVDCK